MGVPEWRGSRIAVLWAAGLTAAQFLLLYGQRPGGAAISLLAHIIIPVLLTGATTIWIAATGPERLAHVSLRNVVLLWSIWMASIGVLHLLLRLGHLTVGDGQIDEGIFASQRRLGWMILVPAWLCLIWLTGRWFRVRTAKRR